VLTSVPSRSLRALETGALSKLRPDHDAGRRAAMAASEAGRHGRMWVGLSAAGALSRRTRAAARDGIVAWGAASTGAVGLKRLSDRRRPRLRGLGSAPRSSSMPSSHTASATAYATAATLRCPTAGVVLLPLAAAVAWSRAATARHFPSDVAAGALVGQLVGVTTHAALPDSGDVS
jgi:membrane-associated phospholipid phosphatase